MEVWRIGEFDFWCHEQVRRHPYSQSLPIRNRDKSKWVRFLYFLDFWMVFVSYLSNFVRSPLNISNILSKRTNTYLFISNRSYYFFFTATLLWIAWFENVFLWHIIYIVKSQKCKYRRNHWTREEDIFTFNSFGINVFDFKFDQIFWIFLFFLFSFVYNFLAPN